jgi:hypothetical protein
VGVGVGVGLGDGVVVRAALACGFGWTASVHDTTPAAVPSATSATAVRRRSRDVRAAGFVTAGSRLGGTCCLPYRQARRAVHASGRRDARPPPRPEARHVVPILLLDVDGVLNAPRQELPPGWQRGTYNGFVLSWDPTVTARLRDWHEQRRVEIQWLTTWAHDADRLLAEPMGLPRGLPVHVHGGAAPIGFLGPLGGAGGWWKLAAARAVAEAEPDRRIIWIDDDLAVQAAETGEWLAANPHVLVVAPDLYTGLTHEQLDAIEAWL